jgi:hypothetical protein
MLEPFEHSAAVAEPLAELAGERWGLRGRPLEHRRQDDQPATERDGLHEPAGKFPPSRQRLLVESEGERGIAVDVLQPSGDPSLDVAEFGLAFGEVHERRPHGGETVDGSEGREIVIPMRTRDPLHFTGEVFLKHWALPNFFFHISMAYALLRQAGVELGKSDFLATP